jgi:glycosidase
VKAEETILAERPSTAVEPAPWWKTEVVYHIYPRSFADSNGDGVGDLRGEIIDFWIERGVSGFRLDVFNAYFKHPELLDNPRRAARSAWRRPRHLYNKDRPELRGFLAELRAKLDQHPGVVAIGETFDGDAKLAASYCDHLHMAFNFDLVEQPLRADRLQHVIARWDTLLAHEHTWPSYVLSNHDNPRHASRLSPRLPRQERDARAKVAAAMLLTLRGTPFVYYGEEIGMNDATIPADVYLRRHETQSVLVALNLTKVTQRLRLDSEAPTRRWVPRLSTRRPDVGWSVILGRELTLGPYEATIFEATRPAT